MAYEKRSLESMQQEALMLDDKINHANDRLHKLQKQRSDLQERIDRAKAFEIIGIIRDHNLSFEEAGKILSAANPVISTTTGDRNGESE